MGRPPGTPTTTTAPDTTSPVINQPVASPGDIWENDTNSLTCPASYPRTSQISATVTDNVSVTSVAVSWVIGGSPTTKAMSRSGNSYTATFGPFDYLTVPDNTAQAVTITIEAKDAAGNSSKANRIVTVHSTAECFG